MARRVKESDWTAIKAIRKANPDWTYEQIGKAVGFGGDVVSRAIRTVSYEEYKLLVKSMCYRKPCGKISDEPIQIETEEQIELANAIDKVVSELETVRNILVEICDLLK